MVQAVARRREYLDWLRGVAVLIMIEAHALDAWTRPADRGSAVYEWAVIVGGMGAPLFLLLAGVSAITLVDFALTRAPFWLAWQLVMAGIPARAAGSSGGAIAAATIPVEHRMPQRGVREQRKDQCRDASKPQADARQRTGRRLRVRSGHDAFCAGSGPR